MSADETFSAGIVHRWDDEDGWGVIRSEAVPGDVFAHFSSIASAPSSFRSLDVGEPVTFTWEQAAQDGFSYRAVTVRSARDGADADADEDEDDDLSGGFASSLTVVFDDERTPPA
ncbi:cold-shock protein [Streptomyces avicenniae]|uniref:cold-shock protein n=1 Tax=Streptomyces avicenniae TaxID=500153 RepID=UPI00069B0150|nr:cold shock domain-containing protein [Streptomyces avicenniae]